MTSDDDIIYIEDDSNSKGRDSQGGVWVVLIVDDEPDVHHVTKFAMKGYTYLDKKVEFISLYSEAEARKWLLENEPPSLILLDVVMETNDSGFRLVKFIRDELKNYLTQIILRTGQPGEAPEEEAIKLYDINDYKLKTDLTREKLFSSLTFSLRSFRDLSILENTKHELLELNQELEEKVKIRTSEISKKNLELSSSLEENRNLLRVISHDLNNYLSVVNVSAKMGLKLASNCERAEVLWDRVVRASKRQSDLVEHVISLEACKSGKKKLNIESVPLLELFRMMNFTFEDKIKAKNISIKTKYLCDENICVKVDPVPFLNSVINNLISNSIKFSEQGSDIHVTVQEIQDRIEIAIKDHGIGIPETILKSLYDLSAKTSRFGTEGEKGTGFGMPLVKSYLEKMGGQIKIESRPKDEYKDHGTTIYVTVNKG